MANAWETTTDDVLIVLTAHNITVSPERLDEIHGDLDHDAIEDGVLCYNGMESQTNSMLDDIETQLMEKGVIPPADKKFVMSDEDDDFDEDEFEDDEEEEDDE